MSKQPTMLITGASGGIGMATAKTCAEKGARIAIHYNSQPDRANALLGSLPGNGHMMEGIVKTQRIADYQSGGTHFNHLHSWGTDHSTASGSGSQQP